MKRLTFVLGLVCLLFSSGSIFATDMEVVRALNLAFAFNLRFAS